MKILSKIPKKRKAIWKLIKDCTPNGNTSDVLTSNDFSTFLISAAQEWTKNIDRSNETQKDFLKTIDNHYQNVFNFKKSVTFE